MATVTIGCKLPHGLHLDVDGTRVTLLGTNAANVIGGYGITEGVDESFFKKWLAQNKDSAAVKNELVFAHEKPDNTKAQAKANAKNRNGFEGVDPNKPAPGVEPTDETKKELAKAGV